MVVNVQITMSEEYLMKLDELVRDGYTDRSKLFRRWIDEHYADFQRANMKLLEEFAKDAT